MDHCPLARALRVLLMSVAGASVLAIATPSAHATRTADAQVEQFVATLESQLDRTTPAVFAALGDSGSPEALDALLAALDGRLASMLGRARALRELAKFVPQAVPGTKSESELATAALVGMALVAAKTSVTELQMEAVEAIAQCGPVGHRYLAVVVDYAEDSAVRRLALERHVNAESAGVGSWYAELFARPDVQLLVLWPSPDAETEQALKTAGALRVLSKPISPVARPSKIFSFRTPPCLRPTSPRTTRPRIPP